MKIEIYGGVILTYNELMMKSLSDLWNAKTEEK